MLSARDQENLAHGHQALAASKPLNQSTRNLVPPKTPANRYPKTPIRIPLNDENAHTGFGKGKSVLQLKGKGAENLPPTGKKGAAVDKNAFITPMGPRTRAPLGMKTTNSKARAFQTPGGLDTDRPDIRPSSNRPLRQKIKPTESSKLAVHTDALLDPDDVPEPEYCPPTWVEPPYVNDDIPEAMNLDYSIVKKANQSKDFFWQYSGSTMRRKAREDEERAQKRMAAAEEKFLKEMAEEIMIVSDVPETHPPQLHFNEPTPPAATTTRESVPLHQRSRSVYDRKTTTTTTAIPTKPPGTVASRRAAPALVFAPRTTHTRSASSGAPLLKREPQPRPALPFAMRAKTPTTMSHSRTPSATSTTSSTMQHASAAMASRSTVGYYKGRTASSALQRGMFDEPSSTSERTSSSASSRPVSRGGAVSAAGPRPRMGLARSQTQASIASGESTLTPAMWARKYGNNSGQSEDEVGSLRGPSSLLKAFESGEDDEFDDGLGAEELRLGGEVELPDEEEFVMTLNF